MEKTDVLVLGGLSGISAAISCRRHYPNKKVVLVRKEGTVLIPCGIPYIFGTVGGPENNVVPDGLLESNNIQLITDEAVEVNRENKVVTLKNKTEIEYEKLVFATGSVPLVPPIPGIEKENVYVVKKEFDYLKDLLCKVNEAKDIVIIGGGFIGMEFADECRKGRDINVTVVEMLPRCLQMALDDEFCDEAVAKLTETGVKVMNEERVVAINGNDKAESIKLASGNEIKADLVILGIGALPNTELAAKAGLELGFKNGIKVDRYMRSVTDSNVFACGDCAARESFLTGDLQELCLHLLQHRKQELQVQTCSHPHITTAVQSVLLLQLLTAEHSVLQVLQKELQKKTVWILLSVLHRRLTHIRAGCLIQACRM